MLPHYVSFQESRTLVSVFEHVLPVLDCLEQLLGQHLCSEWLMKVCSLSFWQFLCFSPLQNNKLMCYHNRCFVWLRNFLYLSSKLLFLSSFVVILFSKQITWWAASAQRNFSNLLACKSAQTHLAIVGFNVLQCLHVGVCCGHLASELCLGLSNNWQSLFLCTLLFSALRSSPVWFFVYFWEDQDQDRSINIPEPQKTGLDHFRPVFFSLYQSWF